MLRVSPIPAFLHASSSSQGRRPSSRKESAVPWSTRNSGKRRPSSISAVASWRRQAASSAPRYLVSAGFDQPAVEGWTIGAKALHERKRSGG